MLKSIMVSVFENFKKFSHFQLFFKIWLNFWKFFRSDTKSLKWPTSRYFWVLMLNLMSFFENLRKISHFRLFSLAKFSKILNVIICHLTNQLVICGWWYTARTLIKVNMVMCDSSNFPRSDVNMISHLIAVKVWLI